jgi:hypothetical protein
MTDYWELIPAVSCNGSSIMQKAFAPGGFMAGSGWVRILHFCPCPRCCGRPMFCSLPTMPHLRRCYARASSIADMCIGVLCRKGYRHALCAAGRSHGYAQPHPGGNGWALLHGHDISFLCGGRSAWCRWLVAVAWLEQRLFHRRRLGWGASFAGGGGTLGGFSPCMPHYGSLIAVFSWCSACATCRCSRACWCLCRSAGSA